MWRVSERRHTTPHALADPRRPPARRPASCTRPLSVNATCLHASHDVARLGARGGDEQLADSADLRWRNAKAQYGTIGVGATEARRLPPGAWRLRANVTRACACHAATHAPTPYPATHTHAAHPSLVRNHAQRRTFLSCDLEPASDAMARHALNTPRIVRPVLPPPVLGTRRVRARGERGRRSRRLACSRDARASAGGLGCSDEQIGHQKRRPGRVRGRAQAAATDSRRAATHPPLPSPRRRSSSGARATTRRRARGRPRRPRRP